MNVWNPISLSVRFVRVDSNPLLLVVTFKSYEWWLSEAILLSVTFRGKDNCSDSVIVNVSFVAFLPSLSVTWA